MALLQILNYNIALTVGSQPGATVLVHAELTACVSSGDCGNVRSVSFVVHNGHLGEVLHGESAASSATPRNQNNNQPGRGQPHDSVQT